MQFQVFGEYSQWFKNLCLNLWWSTRVSISVSLRISARLSDVVIAFNGVSIGLQHCVHLRCCVSLQSGEEVYLDVYLPCYCIWFARDQVLGKYFSRDIIV